VQTSIAEKFIEGLKVRFQGAQGSLGNPSEPTTMLGPLADTKQLETVLRFIEAGKTESGAKLLVGGERHTDKGAFVQPTIFLNPGKESKIYKEEIFGPVLTVLTFDTEEEAIKLANDTAYGLSATVYTGSTSRALRVASKIKAGTIAITARLCQIPIRPSAGTNKVGMGES